MRIGAISMLSREQQTLLRHKVEIFGVTTAADAGRAAVSPGGGALRVGSLVSRVASACGQALTRAGPFTLTCAHHGLTTHTWEPAVRSWLRGVSSVDAQHEVPHERPRDPGRSRRPTLHRR